MAASRVKAKSASSADARAQGAAVDINILANDADAGDSDGTSITVVKP